MERSSALYAHGDLHYVSAKNHENNKHSSSGSSFLLFAGNRFGCRSFGGCRPSEVRQVKLSKNIHGDGIPLFTTTMKNIQEFACMVVGVHSTRHRDWHGAVCPARRSDPPQQEGGALALTDYAKNTIRNNRALPAPVVLVAGMIGVILGQPITLFPPHGKKR